VLVVTGGHGYPTSFYTLFEQPGLVWDHETAAEAAYRRDLRPRYDVLVMYDLVEKGLSGDARSWLNLQTADDLRSTEIERAQELERVVEPLRQYPERNSLDSGKMPSFL